MQAATITDAHSVEIAQVPDPLSLISDRFAVADYEKALTKFTSGQSRKVLPVLEAK